MQYLKKKLNYLQTIQIKYDDDDDDDLGPVVIGR